MYLSVNINVVNISIVDIVIIDMTLVNIIVVSIPIVKPKPRTLGTINAGNEILV